MQLYCGTSGFSYPEWRGSFYPEKYPQKAMLRFYAERLSTVEINHTFYRMPKPEQLAAWAAETPPDFSFVLKAPQAITHRKRLFDCGSALARLVEVSATLGARRGPLLFQLPPFLRKDLGRLDAFLSDWRTHGAGAAPNGTGPSAHAAPLPAQAAIEFRHTSWFSDDVFARLKEAKVALCVAEAEILETPLVATADWGYVRLRRQDYDETYVASWLARIQAQPWSRCHVFFKHEDGGAGPRLAARLLELGAASAPAAGSALRHQFFRCHDA